jgi:hypothetical protein
MPDIHGVLLVPPEGDPLGGHEGDPQGLLAEGVGGSRPPAAYSWVDAQGRTRWAECGDWTLVHALQLAWDGNALQVGCFQVYGFGALFLFEQLYALLHDLQPRRWKTWDDARDYLEGQGRFVLVDADGREVTRA